MGNLVYKAISAVQAELAAVGIGKDHKNDQQGYKFRGIDDVYNELAPFLAKHGLCVLPRGLSREVTERTTAKGTALFYITVAMEFDFICAEDGSKHTVGPMYGEAMDSGDKATNKAMSAAYKYACMQAFCIPTEGDNDADRTTHTVRSTNAPPIQEVGPSSVTKVPPATTLPADDFKPATNGDKMAVAKTLAALGVTAKPHIHNWIQKHGNGINPDRLSSEDCVELCRIASELITQAEREAIQAEGGE